MKLEIKNEFAKLENAGFRNDGVMVNFNPGINGILISYAPTTDYDGNHFLTPYVSTLCVDMEHSDRLTEAARKLLSQIPSIELPTNKLEDGK